MDRRVSAWRHELSAGHPRGIDGGDVVTWDEFVQARLVSKWREKGVPMDQVRTRLRTRQPGLAGPDGVPLTVHPLGDNVPVVIDPLVRGDAPTVRGVPTDALASLRRGGDTIEDLARWYDLSEDEVRSALRYDEAVSAA